VRPRALAGCAPAPGGWSSGAWSDLDLEWPVNVDTCRKIVRGEYRAPGRADLLSGSSVVGATYAFSLGPLFGASLSFVFAPRSGGVRLEGASIAARAERRERLIASRSCT